MNYYINVLIKPDAEMRLNVLLNAIYTKLHKALCDLSSTSIGISFPKYEITLGNLLRIHGDKLALHDLQSSDWIGGMRGYCDVSPILPVPQSTKFRTVSRKQTTMSQAKLRRLRKRNPISGDEVRSYKAKMFSRGLNNPYVELVSGSSGQKHRRYIEFGELRDQPVSGDFDQFGLSKSVTIPWF